jgi:hypothetical protein
MPLIGTLHVKTNRSQANADRERRMAAHCVRFNGRLFEFGPYRFRRLADALAFSRTEAANPRGLWTTASASTGRALRREDVFPDLR